MSFDPERLHVFRCYERLPPLSGGMERHIEQLTAAQRQLGVRVTEVFNRGESSGESVQVWRGRNIDEIRPYVLRSALFYAAAALRNFEFANDRRRVVHVHGDWPSFLFGSMFAHLIRADAIAATLHEWTRAPSQLYALGLRKCDPIFATGLQEARRLAETTRKAVTHLPSAPSDLFFSEPHLKCEAADVIVVGSLNHRKNLELVLEIARRRPKISFEVYGDGPERAKLETMRTKASLKNLRFHGAVEANEIHSAMWSSRLFLSTALAEGSPTAALEAMACRVPVVLTPSNDFSDIVEQGVNGRVTSGWNVDELANAMDEFLQQPKHLTRARDAARATAERHRWPAKARIVTDAMILAAERCGERH